MTATTTPARAYALPTVLAVLLLLALAMLALIDAITGSVVSTRIHHGRRRTFYVAEGVLNAASVVVENALRAGVTGAGNLTTAALAAGATGATTTNSFRLCGTSLLARVPPANTTLMPGFVDAGFNAIAFGVRDRGTRIDTALGTGPFATMNADSVSFCVGVVVAHPASNGNVRLSRAITSHRLAVGEFAMFSALPTKWAPPPSDHRTPTHPVHANGDLCLRGQLTVPRATSGGVIQHGNNCGDPGPQVNVGTLPTGITGGTDSGRGDWRTFALPTWNGRVQDRTHGVLPLRLAVAAVPAVQSPSGRPNDDTLRFIIEPPQTGDAADVRAERLANQADLRILDGIWYLRDPVTNAWPGTPIWSDHPGSYTPPATPGTERAMTGTSDRGQLDIEALATSGPSPWTSANSPPRRYSFYETDLGVPAASSVLLDNSSAAVGVVSYGSLKLDAGQFVPGHLCGGTHASVFAGGACTSTTADLIDATRTGFRDPQSGENVLPLNFNVGALAQALGDTGPGELGGYFQARTFNGIVWIGHTDATPQGAIDDVSSPQPTPDVGEQRAIPAPLCSLPPTRDRRLDGTALGFVVPDCTAPINSARPNAVRVFNAAFIDPARMPRGLTIVTDGPLYVQGDVNLNRARPALLVGDRVIALSNAFDDGNARWDNAPSLVSPVNTRWDASILAGAARTPTTGQLEEVIDLVESWNSDTLTVRGAIIEGFWSLTGPGSRNLPGNRRVDLQVDTALASTLAQPPGMPFVEAGGDSHFMR